jgi:hypothetical protein
MGRTLAVLAATPPVAAGAIAANGDLEAIAPRKITALAWFPCSHRLPAASSGPRPDSASAASCRELGSRVSTDSEFRIRRHRAAGLGERSELPGGTGGSSPRERTAGQLDARAGFARAELGHGRPVTRRSRTRAGARPCGRVGRAQRVAGGTGVAPRERTAGQLDARAGFARAELGPGRPVTRRSRQCLVPRQARSRAPDAPVTWRSRNRAGTSSLVTLINPYFVGSLSWISS